MLVKRILYTYILSLIRLTNRSKQSKFNKNIKPEKFQRLQPFVWTCAKVCSEKIGYNSVMINFESILINFHGQMEHIFHEQIFEDLSLFKIAFMISNSVLNCYDFLILNQISVV